MMIGYVERYEPTVGYGYGNRKVYATRAKNEAGEIEFKLTYTPSSAGKLNAEWQEKFKAFAAQKNEVAKFMTLEEFEQVNGYPL